MKLRIFNKGKGWYVSAINYKDHNDKAYMGVFFTQECGTPAYIESDKGYSVIDIDVIEGWFTSYKNKIGFTVKKYESLTDLPLEKGYETDSKMFGNPNNVIESDDLPFY